MERAAYTKAQLDAYDRRKIDTMTLTSMISASKDEGLEEGKAIGLAIGLEQAAINCQKAGYPIDTIALVTGLTAEQITEILKRNELT